MVRIERTVGPDVINHFNLYRAAEINGAPAPDYSSGQAIQTMERLAESTLPEGMGFEWTGLAFQEIQAGGKAPLVFALSVLVVFLVMAALYESWSLPLVVMLSVPLALLGGIGALALRGLINDVYGQVGLLMLVGLASKNAILIVEFAKHRRELGLPLREAALDAARIRLRPILMTAFAFIIGVLPLVLASGAGANSRQSLGTTVFGGMLLSTLLSILIVPVFYVLVEQLREKVLGTKAIEQEGSTVTESES